MTKETKNTVAAETIVENLKKIYYGVTSTGKGRHD